MLPKWVYFTACVLFSVSDSEFVDTLTKCSYNDDNCVADLIQNIIKDASENGIKDLNLPLIDPMVIKNISVPIFGIFYVTFEEGHVKGLKNCVIDNIHNDLENGLKNMDITCNKNITVETNFKLIQSNDINPDVNNLFGQVSIHGDGNVKLALQKLHMKMKFLYQVIKKDDGEIYLNCHIEELLSNFEINNFKMTVNKMFVGKQDISALVENFFNQNWKSITSTFGSGIFDDAMKILIENINSFFETIPAKHYYTDDLTSFLQN